MPIVRCNTRAGRHRLGRGAALLPLLVLLTGGSCSNDTGASLDALTVTPDSLNLPADQPQLLTAARTRAGLATALQTKVEWSSADSAVATVSAQGNGTALVTGHIPGTVSLTARDSDVTATVNVTVTSFGIMTLAITPADSAVDLGAIGQLTATATFFDNSTADITSRAYWLSTAPNVAPVSNGRAIGASVGTTMISASLNAAGAQTRFTVRSPLTKIDVTPATASIAEGATQQFTATGTLADNTTQDLTKQVTWASGNSLNATVSNTADTQGLARAGAIGATTITATLGKFSATAMLTVTRSTSVCGNGTIEPPELCDDGNTVAGDGCRADCRGKEVCGDGRIDSLRGEQCDDGNTKDGDGCSATCKLDVFSSRAPQIISGTLSCSLGSSNSGRKAAVDQLGRFYVALLCGGIVYVNTSVDRGATWGTPVKTDMANIVEVAIEGGAVGTAYLAGIASNATLVFSRTVDSGATWAASRQLGSGLAAPQVAIDSIGNDVYIATRVSTGPRIFSNYTLGEGTFTSIDLVQTTAFVDLLVDRISGNVMSVTDNPSMFIRVSSDRGATFGAQSNPPGQAFFSDWAGSNGFIYASGSALNDALYVIPVSAPGTSTSVTGVPAGVPQGRAIDADALGNVYMASQLATGGIQLDHLLLNTTMLVPADVRALSATGSNPAVAALPNNSGALVAYTNGTSVYGSVVVYP